MERNLYEGIDEIIKNQEALLEELRAQKAKSQAPARESAAAYTKRFFASAEREYLFCDTPRTFLIKKCALFFALCLFITLNIVATAATARAWQLYSTYSLFENLWLLFAIKMALNVLRARRVTEGYTYEHRSPYRYRYENGFPLKSGRKLRLRIFFTLFVIAAVCNALCCIDSATGVAVSAIVLECVSLVFGIAVYIAYYFFFGEYLAIRFTGPAKEGRGVAVFVYDLLFETMYPESKWINPFYGKNAE